MFYKELETERMYLKNIGKEDREFILHQFSDETINRYLFDAEPISNLEEADEIISYYRQREPRGHHRWILVNKFNGTKMGTCGFHGFHKKNRSIEIGYDLQKDYWGKGYMREALEKIMAFAKDPLEIEKIEACIYPENEKSIQLVKVLGFELTGGRSECFRGKAYPHHIYSVKL